MSNLTGLVPPLELCKLIPGGEFAETVLVWRVPNSSFPLEDEFFEIHERDKCESWMKDKQIPAPTLQEIMDILPQGIELYKDSEYFCSLDMCNEYYGETAVIAALKVWLKLKGIEA